MPYFEDHSRRIGVAYCNPYPQPRTTEDLAEIAENFGELVLTNLEDGAELDTIERWARHAFHYARLAMTDMEVKQQGWNAIGQLFGADQQRADEEMGASLEARLGRV